MTDRIDITQEILFDAVIAKLQKDMELDDSHCYLSAESLRYAQIPQGGDCWIEVCDGGGLFDRDWQQGGGAEQCNEEITILVTCYNRVLADRGARGDRRAKDAKRGWFALKKRILKSLVDEDLSTPEADEFLTERLHVLKAWPYHWDSKNNCGSGQLAFIAAFDWDLS